jgi:hypothetical protein
MRNGRVALNQQDIHRFFQRTDLRTSPSSDYRSVKRGLRLRLRGVSVTVAALDSKMDAAQVTPGYTFAALYPRQEQYNQGDNHRRTLCDLRRGEGGYVPSR